MTALASLGLGVPRAYSRAQMHELSAEAEQARKREVNYFMDYADSRTWNMAHVATALSRLGWLGELMEQNEFCKWFGEEVGSGLTLSLTLTLTLSLSLSLTLTLTVTLAVSSGTALQVRGTLNG